MAWSYSDWESQSTDAARLTRLRQHLDEIHAVMDASMGGPVSSINFDTLNNYLKYLSERRRELEAKVGEVDSDSPKVTSGFTRARAL